tara:strand:+ start:621 stop:2228 length:1608 start_codon:yes stop_codon:yes gene_type:complete
MTNLVLATKWRPKLFSDLIGQDPVVTALVNSLDSKRLHHSYLFTGTRGVGKTTLARILAKCLNCEDAGISSQPCGNCNTCLSIDAGQFVDLYEVDAASRTKVEDTRELLENVQYMPTQGRFKIYLIDEVHMLSTHSFNALLKTLEEPPEHVKFILATTDPQKVPSTILSRCLHFSLSRISPLIIQKQLEKVLKNENVEYEEEATQNISKIADGSMRDALSIAEQCISHGDNAITYKNICKILCLLPSENINQVVSLLIEDDVNKLMELIDKLYYQSIDFEYLLEEIISIFHQTAIFKVTKKLPENSYAESIKKLSEKYNDDEIQMLYQIGVSNLKDMNFAPNYKSGFEMAVIRMIMFMPFDINKHIKSDNSLNKNNKEILNNAKEIKKDIKKNDKIVNNNSSSEILNIENNWDTIVSRLDIDPITRNLAKNISFVSKSGANIDFLIAKNLLGVITKKSKDKLQEALTHYFKLDVNINIEVSEEKLSTLHGKDQDEYNKKISNASNQIENDDFVKTIKEKFDATSVENSVKIKDTN